MCKHSCLVLLALTLVSLPVSANTFVGVKVGNMMVDVPSKNDLTNMAVTIGYGFDTLLADLSVVAEINRTLISGETKRGDDLNFESNGVYLNWQTTRSVFVTLRGGLVVNRILSGHHTENSSGFLWGGSVGTVIGRTRLQIEYTSLAGDAVYLSLSLNYNQK